MHETDPNPKLPPITYESLVEPLIWPRLLRVPAMALAPRRFLPGIFATLFMALIARAGDAFGVAFEAADTLQRLATRLGLVVWSLLGFDFRGALTLAGETGRSSIAEPFRDDAFGFSLVALALLLIWSFVGVAIGRSTAMEIARGERMTALGSLAYGLRAIRAAFAAHVLPLMIVLVLLLVATLVSWIAPALSIVAFVVSLPAFALLALHGLASPMLGASVACERTDAVDAIQRTYAYVLTAPLRALAYALIALALGALAHAVLVGLLDASLAFALSTDGLDESGDGAALPTRRLAALLGAGYALSLFFTSGAVVYLLIRRVCDEQDVTDIMIEPPGRLVTTSA